MQITKNNKSLILASLAMTMSVMAVSCSKSETKNESAPAASTSNESAANTDATEQKVTLETAKAASAPAVQAAAKIESSFKAPYDSGAEQAAQAKASANAKAATESNSSSTEEKAPVVAPVATAPSTPTDKTADADEAKTVTIKKAALEKEFLLQTNMIMNLEVPQLQGLRSKVVAFRKVGNKVYMMEASQGHLVSTTLPADYIITSFPIVSQTAEDITFDFAAGMKEVQLLGDWAASDSTGPTYAGVYNWYGADMTQSYLSKVAFNSKNQLDIRQVGTLTAKNSGLNVNYPVEIRYVLEPYTATEGFVSTRTANFDRMGFFEVNPVHSTSGVDTRVYASKWDTRKVVEYAVSANTPKEYKQAVVDGVLYWNKVFGKEVVRVVDAPVGVTAPDSEYNVIQWVDWDTAGMAYADAQMDPRTGEIKRAQIFMTSVFATSGKTASAGLYDDMIRMSSIMPEKEKSIDEEIADLLDKSKDLSIDKLVKDLSSYQGKSSRQIELSLQGMQSSRLCSRNLIQEASGALDEMRYGGIDEDRVRAVAMDYVREVVAHEVGHTLGLRHNFAGSLAANYDAKDRLKLVNQYLATGVAPKGMVTSSSVMEYSRFEESAINGNMMKDASAPVMTYDAMAIKTLYSAKNYKWNETPLFCTDTLHGMTADCYTFDVGRTPAESGLAMLKQTELRSVKRVADYFAATVAPTLEGSTPKSVEEVALPSADVYASSVLSQQSWIYTHTYDPSMLGSLKVARSFPVVDGARAEEYMKAMVDYNVNSIKDSGDFKTLISMADLRATQERMRTEAETYLASDYFRTGPGMALTDAQVEEIRARLVPFMAKVAEKLPAAELQRNLAGVMLVPASLSESMEAMLKERSTEYVLSTKASKVVGYLAVKQTATKDDGTTEEVVTKVAVSLPEFSYPTALRKLSVSTLAGFRTADGKFALATRTELKQKLADIVKNAINGTDVAKIDWKQTDAAVKAWYDDAVSVVVFTE